MAGVSDRYHEMSGLAGIFPRRVESRADDGTGNAQRGEIRRTVDVISEEHTSQTYLTPPSPPLVMVFLRMTPISSVATTGGELKYAPLVELESQIRDGNGRDYGVKVG